MTEAFSFQFVEPRPPDQVCAWLVTQLAPAMAQAGYRLTNQSPAGISFEKRARPTWTIILSIFLFPIGLLFLLVRDTWTIVLALTSCAEGTRITATGIGDDHARRMVAALADPWP